MDVLPAQSPVEVSRGFPMFQKRSFVGRSLLISLRLGVWSGLGGSHASHLDSFISS